MLKKRILTAIAFLLLVVSSLFAWQETFSSESYDFKQTEALARILGKETGIVVTPVTGTQLLKVLESLPCNQLNESERAIYDDLINRLNHPEMTLSWNESGIKVSPNLSTQFFLHSNKEATSDDWTLGARDILPFFNLEGKVYFTKNIFGMIDFDITRVLWKKDLNKNFFTNLNNSLIADNTYPHKAYFTIGAEHVNLTAGRDTVSLGKGVVGNMVIGNSLWWQDFIKLSAFNGPLNYDMLLMAFDANTNDVFDHNSARELVAVHNFSFAYKGFSVALTEGLLQYGDNILEDIRILNPFFCLHNTNGFLHGNQNNFFGIEFGFTPVKGFDFTIQGIIDQIQISTELQDGKPYAETAPNAYGVLTNVKYTQVNRFGLLNMYFEGAYTSPALYLKEQEDKGYDYHNVDLVVGNKLWLDSGFDAAYLGYKYGPDSIVLSTGAELFTNKENRFYADIFYVVHGSYGMANRENQIDVNGVGSDYYYLTTPTNFSTTTAPEQRFVIKTGVEMNLFEFVDVTSECAFVNVWNYHNYAGKSFRDFQVSVGAKIDVLKLTKHAINEVGK